MHSLTHKALFAFTLLALFAAPFALSSYAQGSSGDGLDCAKGSTHPQCDGVSTTIFNPDRPSPRVNVLIVADSLLYVTVESDAPADDALMWACEPGQVRTTTRTRDGLLIELEQCPTPRGFDPLPENWIDSDVSASYQTDDRGYDNQDGQWINLPTGLAATQDEQARGYAFARVRITITARPRSR